MKFISFLYPYPIRNTEAPHIWSLYKQLEKIPAENLFCIGSADYFKEPEYFAQQGRWEVSWANVGWQKSGQLQHKYEIKHDVFEALDADLLTPNRVWASLITDAYPPLVKALDDHFAKITKKHKIDAVFTLCNCASLNKVAKKYKVPVVHIERGALRTPHYMDTGYFDFGGVNGETEAEARYHKFIGEIEAGAEVPMLEREALLDFAKQSAKLNQNKRYSWWKKLRRKLRAKHQSYQANEFEIGLPLQVEDDSNMLAYSNGFNNFELLSYVHKYFNKKDILVRKHPGGHAFYKVQNDDDSASPLGFLERCKRIVTINSSMGLEALLAGKPAWVMGDNPFNFCASQNPELDSYDEAPDLEVRLNFALFGYLAPFDILFDLDYLKFRLRKPSEAEIYMRHFEYWSR